jgi:hypothetical protein
MKNILLIITLCITTSSMAMELIEEKKEKPNILAEITCIKEPFKALYLTENIVLINGREQCSVVDITTNQKIKRIFDNDCWSSCIAVHPNKTKFALAAYHYPSDDKQRPLDAQQKITIYDTRTYNIEHTIDCNFMASITSMLFSPLDDTIAACGEIKIPLFNYKTNTVTIIDVPEAIRESQGGTDNHNPIISFHPTQPLMTLAWRNVYFHNLETSERTKNDGTFNYYDFCEYSSDGSFIAMGLRNSEIIIKKSNQKSNQRIISNDLDDMFLSTIIHPNNKILITLSRPYFHTSPSPYTLKYWNVDTNGLIATTDLSDYTVDTPYWKLSPSFSPSGKKLIVVLNDKCIELPVPFNVIYKNITKKEFLYLLFLLKNYTSQCDDIEMPQDINILLAQTLLDLYKRE